MSKVTIQKNVPYKESLIKLLSDESWERGIGNFFLEQVPFSYTTSTEYAGHIASFLNAFAQEQDPQSIHHFYEYGAGLGMFSKRLIEQMNTAHPATHAQYCYHITDTSASIVEQLKTLDTFKDVNANFRTLDMAYPQFKADQKPSVVLMNYVLDSLEATQIKVINGEIFEMQLHTHLEEDECLADTTVFPPKLLNQREIKELLLGPASERRTLLLSKLHSAITYEWHTAPLEKSSLTEASKTFLKDYVASKPKDLSYSFNYSEGIVSGLQQLFQNCAQDALIMLYDFGDMTDCPDYPDMHLIGSFGVCKFLLVHFPFITELAEQNGFTVHTIKALDGESQFVALARGKSVAAIADLVQQKTPQLLTPKSHKISDDVLKFSAQDPAFLATVQHQLSSLTETECNDHTLLIRVATECAKRGLNEAAIHYAEKLLSLYGKTALTTYHLLGEVYQNMQAYDKAEQYLLDGLASCPYYAGFYHQLTLLYGKTGQFEKFSDYSKQYYKYSDDTVIWDHLITYALIQMTLGNRDDCMKILDWIMRSHDRQTTLLPAYMSSKAQALKSELKTL